MGTECLKGLPRRQQRKIIMKAARIFIQKPEPQIEEPVIHMEKYF
jgi:hypothetical protein